MSKSKMSADKIVEIMKWSDKGLNATDVSRVLGISDSCTQKYVSIVNSIRKKENYCIHPNSINEKAIEEYCTKVGLKKTENTYAVDQQAQSEQYEQIPFVEVNPCVQVEEVRAKMIDAVNALLNFLMGV